MTERENLNLSQSQYQRYRKILDKVRKDRLGGRLLTSQEWPAWSEVEAMALAVVTGQ